MYSKKLYSVNKVYILVKHYGIGDKMAKWKSPLFSDIRNKLGESAVFSAWKGRNYFRGYVIPANPKTNAQKAHRAALKNLVARWQEIVTTDTIKAAWNKYALDYQISGYNLFTKFGRKSKISVPATASGSGSATVTVTYTLGLPAADAKCYRYDGTNWVDVTPAAGLESGNDKTFNDTVTASGTYYYFIGYGKIVEELGATYKKEASITKWKPDTTTGTAPEAKCVVTIS